MNTETRSSSVKKSGNSKAEPSEQPTSIVTAEVEVVGVTPLLQHRWSESAEGESGKSTRTVLVVRGTPREEAEARGSSWYSGIAHGSEQAEGQVPRRQNKAVQDTGEDEETHMDQGRGYSTGSAVGNTGRQKR